MDTTTKTMLQSIADADRQVVNALLLAAAALHKGVDPDEVADSLVDVATTIEKAILRITEWTV